jgi:PhnB protein
LVENVQDALEFLSAVFGAQLSSSGDAPPGALWQAEVRLGDTAVKIGRSVPDDAPAASVLYVWVDDVDAAFARALEAGATPLRKPTDQDSGLREAGFRDPQGGTWWIGARLRRLSNAEVERRIAQQRRTRL